MFRATLVVFAAAATLATASVSTEASALDGGGYGRGGGQPPTNCKGYFYSGKYTQQGYFPYAGCDGSEPRLRGPARVAPLMERRLSKESNLATLLPRDDDHAEATTIIARLACEFGKTSPMRCFRARLNLSGGHILPRTRYLGSGRERLLFFNELMAVTGQVVAREQFAA
jgi:hypothetical protein